VIGTGWGSIVHVPAYRLVDGYQVAAICARRPESVAAASESLGIADTSTDWRSFVRRDDLDVISVASLVHQHRDMALAALGAGKHVVCEKPLAARATEAAEMVRAAEEAGRVTAACFEMRWTEERLAVWEAVRAGVAGTPFTLRLHQSADYWHPSRPLQHEWMYRRDQGGGYLHGLMSHDIDFVLTLLGPPTAVCAEVHTSMPVRTRPDGSRLDVDADDSAAVLLRFASGAVAFLTTSVVGVGVRGYDLQLFGEAATITSSTVGGSSAAILRPGAEAEALAPSSRMPASGRPLPARRAAHEVRAMALLLEDLKPAFDGADATRGLPTPTFGDAWQVERVIEAARASADGAGWVSL
jgi:predicted dehydrogenase